MLLTFRAPPPSLAGSTPPARLLIAKWGRNESVKGPFTVNETTQKMLPVMQRQMGFDSVAADFEHNTVPGTVAYNADKEPRKVAAHGRLSVVPGEGIYLESPTWTPEGIASVTGGHHPDLSPAIKTNSAGEIVFVHSVALCRQGACTDLHVFSAGLTDTQLQTFSATLTQHSSAMDYKALLLLLLGLETNSTDADITTAAKAFATKVDAACKQAGTLTTLSATVKELGEKFTALVTTGETAEREAITAAALRDGKLIPHSATTLPLASFKAIVAELPAGIVPLDQRTPAAIKTFSASIVPGSESAATAETIRKAAGLTAEEFAKYAK